MPEVVTEERIAGLVKVMLVTMPEGCGKPWLACPEEQLAPFSKELAIYCNNHDLDPSEYLGDWFPLAIAGMPIAFGMMARHKEHKKGEIKQPFDAGSGVTEPVEPPEEVPEEVPDARPDDAKESMMPSDSELPPRPEDYKHDEYGGIL